MDYKVNDSDVEVDRASSHDVQDRPEVRFEYSIKIMNPGRLSEFKNVRICEWKRFGKLKDLRAFLTTKVPSVDVGGEKPDNDHVDLGYLEPGHGTKGKKQWLNTDEDIQVMYENHEGKRSIQLWACPTCSRKEW